MNNQRANQMYQSLCQVFPSLAGASEYAGIEVESAANMYFQKIYKEELTVNEARDLLVKFKNSPSPTEKEVFACMISNLFDEYRFHSQYPLREL